MRWVHRADGSPCSKGAATLKLAAPFGQLSVILLLDEFVGNRRHFVGRLPAQLEFEFLDFFVVAVGFAIKLSCGFRKF